MAVSKDWAELSDEELYDLITRPLSAAELAEYQEVLSGEDFSLMVGRYHADAAISNMRTLVLEFFKHGVSFEMMITALANVWLDNFDRLMPNLDAETVMSWRQMPQLLVQILLQQALDALNDQRDRLITEYPPEYKEMYQAWSEAIPAPQAAVTDPELLAAELERQGQQTLILYQHLSEFAVQLQQTGFQLEQKDYLELWTQVLLQTYLFAQEGQQELYFLIQINWSLFMERLGQIVTLMTLLRGAEALLLPENRGELEHLLYTTEVGDSLEEAV